MDDDFEFESGTTKDNVVFDEENSWSNEAFIPYKNPKMVEFVLKTGLAKNAKGAEKVLIGASVVFILSTIFVITQFLFEKEPEIKTYDQLTEVEKLQLPTEIRQFLEEEQNNQ